MFCELTHQVPNTKDHAHGKIKCGGLGATRRENAVTNADNFGSCAASFIKAN